MQIFAPLYSFLTVSVCFVLGFDKVFLKFLLGGFVSMECGFFLFENFKQVYKFLGLLLLFAFGFRIFYSDSFSRGGLVRFLCDLRWEPEKLKYGFCSKNVIDGIFRLLKILKEIPCESLIDKPEEDQNEKLNNYNGTEGKIITGSGEEYLTDNNVDDEKEFSEEDGECDVSTLRKLLKIERRRAKAAIAELAKERAASATAAEETMAMILRLQNEKSLIEMESSQFKRLAEEKQIHDQEVIRSLQWLLWDHEFKRSLLEDQLKLYRKKMKKDESEEFEEDGSSFNGSILDALENVLYSSLDE
ncbi:hypothetical protein ACS0TY_002853 [Phlomoides rotata]